MAVVIAGILGCDPPFFFYTQLFEPTKLKNTYIPGFMVCEYQRCVLGSQTK